MLGPFILSYHNKIITKALGHPVGFNYIDEKWGTYKAWQIIGAQVRSQKQIKTVSSVYWQIQEKENKDTGEKDDFPDAPRLFSLP